MSAITYTYRVIASSPTLKMMEVEYTAEGYPTMLVGMPLPVGDATVASVVEQYAPIHRWVESTAVVVKVPVNSSGIITYDSTPAVVAPPTSTPTPAPVFNPAIFEERVLAVLAKYGVPIAQPTSTP